jgi:membrane protein
LLTLLTDTVSAWLDDRCASRSAALAFYTVLSVAPILVIAVAVAGAVFGAEAASGALVVELRQLIGDAGARLMEELLTNARYEHSGMLATVLAGATLLVGATTAFAEMKDSLDQIWGVQPPRGAGGVMTLLRTRLLSFGMVLFLAFLLLVSLIVSAALTAAQRFLGAYSEIASGRTATFVLSFALGALLFAVIFKFLPERRLSWRNAGVGALVTAFLFVLGRFAIGLYIGNSAVASTFGAAASVVVLMLWVYYSTMIFFLGAEFARLWSGLRPLSSEGVTAKPA